MARIAPPSQPGTSTQTTVTSAGPPGRGDGVAQRDRVAGVGDDDLVGQAGVAQQAASRLGRDDADRCAGAGVAGRGQASEPDLPAPPITATTGRPAVDVLPTTRAVSAGAPHTSITARLSSVGQVVGQHRGDRAAEQDGVAVAGHLLGAAVPVGEPVRR